MADEQSNAEGTGAAPTQAQAAAPAPQAQAARVFSQEEVDAIVEARLAKQRARLTKAKPEPEAPQGEASKGDDPTTGKFQELTEQVAGLAAQLKRSEADRTFAEKVQGFQLSSEQRQVLRAMWNPDAPDTVDAAIKAFGVGQPRPADAPRYRDPGAPSGAPEAAMEVDATKWSADYIAQLRSSGKFLEELEKFRSRMPGGGAGLFRKRIPKAS
jgi:hypothetical protein